MSPAWRLATVGSFILASAVVLGAIVHAHPDPFVLDLRWADRVASMRAPGWTFVALRIFDPLGRFPTSWIVVLVIALVLIRAGRRAAVAVLVAGEIASWTVNDLVKALVDRPRPPHGMIDASGASYPSGHAAFAAVTAVLAVALLVPAGRRIIPTAVGAVLVAVMAWSRTYLGVHWLTDVAGGPAVGAGVGLIAIAIGRGTMEPTPPVAADRSRV